MNTGILYSFVIPAYNEEKNIQQIYSQIIKLNLHTENKIEIIFINDGSSDSTEQVITNLAEKDNQVKLINLSRNFGHQTALTAGLTYAKGDAIISMDCDLQDPPKIITQMIEKWQNGAEIVYAKRQNYRKDNLIKRIGSKVYYGLMRRYSNIEIPGNVGDFRLIDKKILNIINSMGEHSRYIRGMVAWTGFKHDFVEYQRPDRDNGTSSYSIEKLAQLGMNGVLNFSSFPLKIGLILGFISIIIGSGLFLYQLIDAIANDIYYHLYKWLTVIMIIFMGLMFILLWIIGQYISKIYDEVRGRPLFIVKNTLNVK